MNPISPETIYTKTAKGVLEIRNKAVKLPRELGSVFLSVDGKNTVGDLLSQSGMTAPQFQHALNTLVAEGYIRIVSGPPAAPAAHDDGMGLEFTSTQAMAKLNMEAASRALAESEANKRAQQESRAATEARLRQEAEAHARALAEARADAEAEAKAKAEAAARMATEERTQAERELAHAAEPAARAQAEARMRTAASAAARAEAEARVRAEAEGRARALADVKKAAEDGARAEAEARARAEEQAQARAAAEARARQALEAQLAAMQGARAYEGDPHSHEGELARARVRKLEQEAERARGEARAIAEAEGRAHEEPQPELDIADRVRQLNVKVQTARQSREDTDRATHVAPNVEMKVAPEPLQERAWPSLQMGAAADGELPKLTPEIVIPLPGETSPSRHEVSSTGAAAETDLPVVDLGTDLPVVDLNRADTLPHPEQHLQSALERAMAQVGERAKEETKPKAVIPAPAPSPTIAEWTEPLDLAPDPEPVFVKAPAPALEEEPSDKVVPTIEESEPTRERFNVDRAAYDVITESAEARRKGEAEAYSRSAALARQKRKEDEARREAVFERIRKRRQAIIGGAIGLVVVVVGILAWFQFTPLNGYIPGAQQALSARLNQPVTIASLRYVFLPTPRLVLEGVAVGTAEGVRANRVEAHALPFTLFGDPKRFGTVDAYGVTIEPSMLGTIPAWTGGRSASAVHVDRLRLSEVKVDIPKSELGTFDGDVEFAPNGTLKKAAFSNPAMKLELVPQNDGVRGTFEVGSWKLPFVPSIEFDRLTVKGTLNPENSVSEYSGRLAGGALAGTLNAKWNGPIVIQGDFKLDNAQLRELTRALAPDLEAKGTLKASGRYTLQGGSAAGLLTNPQAEINFSIVRGELSNIDLVRGIQSPGAAAFRGGRTVFEELSGTLQIANGHYTYRQVQLTSGPLNATATIDVNPGGELSGRLSAELASRSGVVARQVLAVGGTVKDPQLKR